MWRGPSTEERSTKRERVEQEGRLTLSAEEAELKVEEQKQTSEAEVDTGQP
jgi:hypothetical protein